MTKLKARAKAVDRAMVQLEAAVAMYAEECRRLDKEFRAKQKAKPSWPGRPRSIQPHPEFESPLRHVKAAMASYPSLCRAVGVMPSRGRTVAGRYEKGE